MPVMYLQFRGRFFVGNTLPVEITHPHHFIESLSAHCACVHAQGAAHLARNSLHPFEAPNPGSFAGIRNLFQFRTNARSDLYARHFDPIEFASTWMHHHAGNSSFSHEQIGAASHDEERQIFPVTKTNQLRESLLAAESELYGGVSPRVAPFVDVRDAGGLLQRAGFALPVADADAVTVRYDSLFHLMRDLRAMGATNALTARTRRPVSRRFFLRAAEIYADRFSDADGRIRATFDFTWLSGWAPASSQPKPLRPGSAKVSLASVLPGANDSGGQST